MAVSGHSYIIAGAGITGLTLALALAKFGASVTVLERSPGVQEFGAGLQISPNARRVLNGLGLDDALSAVALEPRALDVYAGGAQPVVQMELGRLMRDTFGAAYAILHRADLAETLYRACRRFANIDIVFGVTRWDAADTGDGVSVAIGGADSRTLRARALIGADGVHSQTRMAVLGLPPARFGNRIAWRALISEEAGAGLVDMDRATVHLASGFHLVCYPLPQRRQINLALFMPARSADAENAQPKVSGGGRRVGRIVAAATGKWRPWALNTVSLDSWSRGNVGLIGDAAHAMVPFQAQGAAMGIEDAAVLAPLLLEKASTAEAFAAYEAVRLPRVRAVAALSARNGRIFHLPWPLGTARNLVMRMQGRRAHLRRLGWIYGHDAAAGTAWEP